MVSKNFCFFFPAILGSEKESNFDEHMGVSKNNGNRKSSILIGVFHYKPSILGYPYFWKHPYLSTGLKLETTKRHRIFGHRIFVELKPGRFGKFQDAWRHKRVHPRSLTQPLKNGGWKTTFPIGKVTFQGAMLNFRGVDQLIVCDL